MKIKTQQTKIREMQLKWCSERNLWPQISVFRKEEIPQINVHIHLQIEKRTKVN